MEQLIKDLLESGAHFGHQTHRWNPKMAPFIFGAKNKVHILDLTKTAQKIEEAKKFVSGVVSNGGKILFVGTKKQAQDAIKEEALGCGMPYVNERWLGGMLTNFQTILSRTRYLKELYAKIENKEGMTKKELLKATEEARKIESSLGGIKDLLRLPEAVYVVDISKEMTAVKEALKMNIPIIAIVDTNVNPDIIEWPIPANDDAVKSIKLITSEIAKAAAEATVVAKEEVTTKEGK